MVSHGVAEARECGAHRGGERRDVPCGERRLVLVLPGPPRGLVDHADELPRLLIELAVVGVDTRDEEFAERLRHQLEHHRVADADREEEPRHAARKELALFARDPVSAEEQLFEDDVVPGRP